MAEISQLHPSAIIVQPEGEELRKIYLLVSPQEETLVSEHFLTWQKACLHWELELGEALPPYHFI